MRKSRVCRMSAEGYGDVQEPSTGDTRSIVLALQSLQEKIRRLEDERNYHRDKCDAAHAAHELFKRDVELQLDREREEHRDREAEMRRLLGKAADEKRQLEQATEVSRADLVAFRRQLDALIESERSSAHQREEVLRAELETYRSEIVELGTFHEKLDRTISQLKAEREVILATNKRLEGTVADLIKMNNSLIGDGRARGNNKAARHERPSLRCTSTCRRHDASILSVDHPVSADNVRITNSMRSRSPSSYRDPTVASLARASAEYMPRQQSPGRLASPAPSQLSGQRHAGPRNEAVSLEAIYAEVENEYQGLLGDYKALLLEATPNQNVVNELVKALSQKAEQLRLMRLARAGGSVTWPTGNRSQSPRGTRKAVQRGAIVNQLRTMLNV